MPKQTFFARHAVLILVIVFFFVPFSLRGARMALQGMKNDVKDWLPQEFEETKDLAEFRQYFLSEQFVLVSWDGCYGDAADQRYQMFLAKLMPETPPSVLAKAAAELEQAELANAAAGNDETIRSNPPASADASEAPLANPTRYIHKGGEFIGDKLGLYFAGDWYENWGEKGEKWLKGRLPESLNGNEECWYYITPDGDLFRWTDVDAPPAALARSAIRALGNRSINGKLVHSFGPLDGAWYHEDPRRLRAQLFKTVTTGPDVLASLTREGGELDATRDPGGEENQKEAERRLAGTLFGPDGDNGKKTTCMVLTLTDAARQNLHLVLGRGMLGKPRGRLYEIANESNIADEELRMGGPPVDNVAIDEEGSITLVRLISYSAVLGITLSLLCFRSITATIMIFFVGGISAVTSIALVWWLGSSIDAIMMSMPSLVYVLGLSGAAHILNYYHDAVEEHGHAGAPERAVAHGWKPAFLCEVTTAIGLVTLVTSELVPIRKFGAFSALGVMVMFVVMLTYLPAALQIWPQKKRKKPAPGQEQGWLDSLLANFWQRLGGWIIDHHAFTAIGCTLVILAFGFGVTHMRTSVNLLKMFHSEAKIIKDYEWLEANLGQLVPMEVVLRVPAADQRPSNAKLQELQTELALADTPPARKAQIQQVLHESQYQLSFLERMELAARVQKLIEAEFGPDGRDVVGRAISAATFVRPLPASGGSNYAYLTRATTSGRLQAHKEDFLHSDYLRVTEHDQTELWRVSLRVGATKGVDYGAFVSQLQQTVEPVVIAQREQIAILRRLGEQRPAGAEAKSLVNSRVLLVGMPVETAGAANGASGKSPGQPIDQQRIFSTALRDMLAGARLKIDTVSEAEQAPEKVIDKLASYDCVVLVGDAPWFDPVAVAADRLVIDDRDIEFAADGSQPTAFKADPTSVAAVYTGVVPIVYKAQRMLLESLIESTFWSIITITPLLMWIARSFSAGAVSMLPNVLPILMVFGGMGWLGIEVDVGSMMTASIALGVAVDDTIHYLNWFREELDRLGDRKKAILAAYKHCATPTLQAAIISGLGLSVFAFSTFTPTQRFGVLMLVILWLGAIAELIYFPALLAGPLGSVFKPRKAAHPAADGLAHDAAELSPPQLVVIRHDDHLDDSDGDASHILSAEADPSGNGHAIPRPNQPRRTRPDTTTHRRS
jgi:predicted RND superfamily exporter protein